MKIGRSLLLGIFVLGAGSAQFPANAVTLPAHIAADSAVTHVTFVKKDHHKKKHFYKTHKHAAHKHAHLHKHLKKKH